MSGREHDLRERLEAVLAPAVVELLEELVAERVRAELAAAAVSAGESPWLSVPEASARLGVSERTIERRIASGRLHSITIGRRRIVHRDELDSYAAVGEETAPTAPPRRRRG